MLLPHQWKNGKITNREDIVQLSQILDKLLNDVKQVIYNMMQENNIDIFDIPRRLELLHSEKIGFLDYCAQRAEIRKYGKKKDSQSPLPNPSPEEEAAES